MANFAQSSFVNQLQARNMGAQRYGLSALPAQLCF
jgi:hypothetical protein